jgi:hypothetical protein
MDTKESISVFNTLMKKKSLNKADKQQLANIFNKLLSDNRDLREDNEELKNALAHFVPRVPNIEITKCF